MEIYKAIDDDRLDKIVYRHYGNLENFSQVLAINCHLNAVLKLNDKVYLPKFEPKPKQSAKLW